MAPKRPFFGQVSLKVSLFRGENHNSSKGRHKKVNTPPLPCNGVPGDSGKFLHNPEKPDHAFRTDRAEVTAFSFQTSGLSFFFHGASRGEREDEAREKRDGEGLNSTKSVRQKENDGAAPAGIPPRIDLLVPSPREGRDRTKVLRKLKCHGMPPKTYPRESKVWGDRVHLRLSQSFFGLSCKGDRRF
jgi:hypothetical protein